MRLRWALALAAIAISASTVAPVAATATPPPYVTILFSRAQWSVQESCKTPAGAITLKQVADELQARGWIGTGSVVTGRINTTTMKCMSAALYPTWPMLEQLHADDGWEATSHSATYAKLTSLTRTQQFTESCGTLSTFEQHGFDRAWGMFSYPDSQLSSEIQTDVVSTCFAYARRYSPDPNGVGSMRAPWWAHVRPVNGGACNLSGAACYSIDTNYRYVDPGAIADYVRVTAGQWAVPQFHKLVSGSKLAGVVRWDCSSTDWRLHFTNRTEVYCWNDYHRVLNAIPDAAIVTDPATVARSWNSNPAVLALYP